MPEPFAPAGNAARSPSPIDQFVDWVRIAGAWYAASFIFHMLLMCALMVIGTAVVMPVENEAPSFDEAELETPVAASPVQHFELEDEAPGLDPSKLDLQNLSLNRPPGPTVEETENIYYDDSPIFTERGGGRPTVAPGPSLGGMGGFNIVGMGPGVAVQGPGGVGSGVGTGTNPGSGGSGIGFGGRGSGMKRAMVGGYGGTKQGERAVALALDWFRRHQFPDGHWGLQTYTKLCTDKSCTPPGTSNADVAATAFGLLPFLAAGQTPDPKTHYHDVVRRGLAWLMRNQAANGDLAPGSASHMYAHGLAAIAVCEAYGMTKDRTLGQRAQLAVNFIQWAQNPDSGGWRYEPRTDGDTSVAGWQIMALKSGQMAGLSVDSKALEGARKWLKSASGGNYGGLFGYVSKNPTTTTMTSVGLLCSQYLGVRRGDPLLSEGVAYLMANLPDNKTRNLYYWYYATQVLHNVPGPEWDVWNRRMRRALIETQVQEGCAQGSWNVTQQGVTASDYTQSGGRIMSTSLACLTLEVYYRFLPLYKLDAESPPENISVIQPGIAPPPLGKP